MTREGCWGGEASCNECEMCRDPVPHIPYVEWRSVPWELVGWTFGILGVAALSLWRCS